MAAPDIEKEMAEGQQFIIVSTQETTVSGTSKASSLKGTAAQSAATGASEAHFDIDFSDIQTEAKEPTREDIIAAAEAAAFK